MIRPTFKSWRFRKIGWGIHFYTDPNKNPVLSILWVSFRSNTDLRKGLHLTH